MKNIETVLFLYSYKNNNKYFTNIFTKIKKNKYINSIQVDNEEIIDYLKNNESGIIINFNDLPVFVIKYKDIKLPVIYSLNKYNIVLKKIQQYYDEFCSEDEEDINELPPSILDNFKPTFITKSEKELTTRDASVQTFSDTDQTILFINKNDVNIIDEALNKLNNEIGNIN